MGSQHLSTNSASPQRTGGSAAWKLCGTGEGRPGWGPWPRQSLEPYPILYIWILEVRACNLTLPAHPNTGGPSLQSDS